MHPAPARSVQIIPVDTAADIERYIDFASEVYRDNPYWVAPDRHFQTAQLTGQIPQAAHCKMQPFIAEQDGRIVATVMAVRDDNFNEHWKQQAGHLLLFEAVPDSGAAVYALLDAACRWLREQGCEFARFSFLIGWSLPPTTDAYDRQPSFAHGFNPPYYHRLIKDVLFFTEKGIVQYEVEFSDELGARYQTYMAEGERTGIQIKPWDFSRLEEETARFNALYNETFAEHWGAPQMTVDEMLPWTVGLREMLVPEFNLWAEVNGQLAGGIFAPPDVNQLMKGQELDHGMLLCIGVKKPFRGKGVNLALGARCYSEMMRKGYKRGSYTVVLDDNWPSRKTALKLGCHVTRNFVVYRRDLA